MEFNENLIQKIADTIEKKLIKLSGKNTFTDAMGNENKDVLQPSQDFREAFNIKNEIGNLLVEGYQVRYAPGLDSILLQIHNSSSKRNLLVGNNQLCHLGNRTDAPISNDMFRQRFEFENNSTLTILIATKDKTVNPGDISLILFANEI